MQVFALYCLLKIGALNCQIKEILYFTLQKCSLTFGAISFEKREKLHFVYEPLLSVMEALLKIFIYGVLMVAVSSCSQMMIIKNQARFTINLRLIVLVRCCKNT